MAMSARENSSRSIRDNVFAQGIAHFLHVPSGGDDAITGLQRGLGSAGPDTAARTCD